MNTITAPENTKISLELPTPLLSKTKGLAKENMCSLSAIVRQSLKETIVSIRFKCNGYFHIPFLTLRYS